MAEDPLWSLVPVPELVDEPDLSLLLPVVPWAALPLWSELLAPCPCSLFLSLARFCEQPSRKASTLTASNTVNFFILYSFRVWYRSTL